MAYLLRTFKPSRTDDLGLLKEFARQGIPGPLSVALGGGPEQHCDDGRQQSPSKPETRKHSSSG